MAKKTTNYFEYFNSIAAIAVQEAEFLENMCKNFDANALEQNKKDIHVLENKADSIRHELLEKLMKEFLPPFEHADINELVEKLDSMCDELDDVVLKMYIYNVEELRPGISENLSILTQCVIKTQELVKELENYRKTDMTKLLMVVNDYEEKGDDQYEQGTRNLYLTEKDPILVNKWTEIYREIEEAYDACEEVAEIIRMLVVKNS